MSEDDNLDQMMTFLNDNRDATFDPRIGAFDFRGLVTYSAAETKTFETSVRVETVWNVKLCLGETRECPSQTHHLDFQPKWQSMRYDQASNALVITHKSAKMGTYQVTITALPRDRCR